MFQYYKSAIISILIVIITIFTIYGADRIIGSKFNKIYSGWNKEGYRGELRGKKKIDSKRIIALGGSTTFGYGTTNDKSWPYLLEENLKSNNINIDVINLGGLSHGMWAIHKDIKHYNYLDYDYAIIFNGYNDINPETLAQYSKRHNNPIFKKFGYLPTLDVYLYEKLALLFYDDLAEFYASKRNKDSNDNIFFFNYKNKLKSDDNKKIQEKLKQKLEENKKEPFEDYLNEYLKVINYLNKKKIQTIIIHQPNLDNEILDLQKIKVDKLILNHQNIKVLNFRELIDLQNKKLSSDGMHLTFKGNKIIADEIFKKLKDKFKNN